MSEELIKVAENKRNNDFTFREQYWANLEKYSSRLLQGKSIESYHLSTELSFEYSHDNSEHRHAYAQENNACQRYLYAHQLFTEGSFKHQDIFSIGKNTDGNKKREALIQQLPALKKNGYSRIVYINLASGTEEVLYQKTPSIALKSIFFGRKKPEKVYRLFHAQQTTHREMMALQALSGPLVGVTGDQSFGEALSSEKVIVYECLAHKEVLAKNFIDTFKTLDLHSDKQASRLAELLIEGTFTSENTNKKELRALLQNPSIIQRYQTICRKIQQENNLAENLVKTIEAIIPEKLESIPEGENQPSHKTTEFRLQPRG